LSWVFWASCFKKPDYHPAANATSKVEMMQAIVVLQAILAQNEYVQYVTICIKTRLYLKIFVAGFWSVVFKQSDHAHLTVRLMPAASVPQPA